MSKRYKFFLYEKMHAAGTRLLQEKGEVAYASSLDERVLVDEVREADAIVIRANGAVSRAVIAAAANLKVIGRHGANGLRRLLAFSCMSGAAALIGYGWWLQFWGWN